MPPLVCTKVFCAGAADLAQFVEAAGSGPEQVGEIMSRGSLQDESGSCPSNSSVQDGTQAEVGDRMDLNDAGLDQNATRSGIPTVQVEEEGEGVLDVHNASSEQDATSSSMPAIQKMGENEEENAGLDYEMHYETSQRSVKEVVKEILQDIATNKNLHDWDNKLVITRFKKLETVIRSYLAQCSQEMLNDLLIHSSVDEVRSEEGNVKSTPAIQENGQANGQFFFSKVSSS